MRANSRRRLSPAQNALPEARPYYSGRPIKSAFAAAAPKGAVIEKDDKMYAVIRTGGKQYKVAADDILKIEKIPGAVGETVQFSDVLMLGGEGDAQVGAPLIDGASVAAEVVEQGRGDKIIVFKKKRRKNYRRKLGHRQDLTVVRITEILTGGGKPSKAKAARKADEAAKTEKKAAAKTKVDQPKTAEKPAAKKPEAKPAAEKQAAKALFKAPKGEPDDLKKISGVGPAIEKKLNDQGITKFEQIAAFSKQDIAKVDEVLNFKGRIERDDWIAQAKKLAKDSGK